MWLFQSIHGSLAWAMNWINSHIIRNWCRRRRLLRVMLDHPSWRHCQMADDGCCQWHQRCIPSPPYLNHHPIGFSKSTHSSSAQTVDSKFVIPAWSLRLVPPPFYDSWYANFWCRPMSCRPLNCAMLVDYFRRGRNKNLASSLSHKLPNIAH